MGLSLALISSVRRKKRSPKAIIKGRAKRRRREDNWVLPEIPLELQIEIMTRLPAKSLMRFKCVSKLWFSLICSRYICNLYRTVARPPRPPHMFMSLVDHLDCNSMGVCHKPYESVLLSLSSSSSGSLDQDLILPGMGGCKMAVVHGLILYFVCGKACIFNPTTRQCVTLPAFKSNMFARKGFCNFYYFGYDPVADQYKIVCTVALASKKFKRIRSEHWVLVVEAGGSWKKIEFDQQPHRPTKPGVFINGVIYYLASTCMSRNIVVSFDVRSEEFNIVQGPDDVVPAYQELVGFIEYGGKPAIFDYTRLEEEEGLVNLWVLEDGGKWSKKSLVLQPCHMPLVECIVDDMVVAGTTQSGEVILIPLELISPFYILYYDLQKNHLRKVEIKGIPEHWFGKPGTDLLVYFKHMDEIESIMHLEI